MANDDTYFLDDFLYALKTAIYRSNRKSWANHLTNLRSYFNLSPKGEWEPRTVKMLLPSSHVDEDNSEDLEVHEVPVASLVDHRAMNMAHLNLEFECYLEGLLPREDTDAEDGVNLSSNEYPGVTIVIAAGERRLPKAKVSIEYRSDQLPEGVARVNDALLKYF